MEAKHHVFFKNNGDAFSLACDPVYLRWSTGSRCSGEVGRTARSDATIERLMSIMWQRREFMWSSCPLQVDAVLEHDTTVAKEGGRVRVRHSLMA